MGAGWVLPGSWQGLGDGWAAGELGGSMVEAEPQNGQGAGQEPGGAGQELEELGRS